MINFTEINKEMAEERSGKKHTNKDIKNIIAASESGDWSEVHRSKLYQNFGGHYCSLLEVLQRQYWSKKELEAV